MGISYLEVAVVVLVLGESSAEGFKKKTKSHQSKHLKKDKIKKKTQTT